MYQILEEHSNIAKIKVIGVGGAGGNAINNMVNAGVTGVDFIAANTDAQDLKRSAASITLQLGQNVTRGLGAGANPDIGRQAADESREQIKEALNGSDMVFITAGMGGGTGTGAAPIVAEVARELDILTIGVVTKPFPFEMRKRMKNALSGIEELARHVDSLVTIPNEKLLTVFGKEMAMMEAFLRADDVLRGAVAGISELLTRPGVINVDLNDVRTIMKDRGVAMMGTASASGDNRAKDAATRAISSPLLDDVDLHGAQGLLVNITGGTDLGMAEFQEVNEIVTNYASEDAEVIVGSAVDENMNGEIRVTVVATGLNQPRKQGHAPAEPHLAPAAPVMPLKAASGWDNFDRHPNLRQASTTSRPASPRKPLDRVPNYADLDIPAFLRKQAD